MADAHDLTGEWHGDFSYPAHEGPTTPFVARLEERGGQLTGTIIEPHHTTGATIAAHIAGLRRGSAVDFTKTYPASGEDYATPVDYVGQVSADGDTVTGVWSLLHLDGQFEMRRERGMAEARESAVGEEAPVD